MNFTFHGDELDVVTGEGEAHVGVRRVCEALGVSAQGQIAKLQSDPSAVIKMILTTGPDGKTYETACINLRALPLWLARPPGSPARWALLRLGQGGEAGG